jgi:hypothetical protein
VFPGHPGEGAQIIIRASDHKFSFHTLLSYKLTVKMVMTYKYNVNACHVVITGATGRQRLISSGEGVLPGRGAAAVFKN